MNINGNEENVPMLGRSVTFSRGLPPVAAAVPAQAATNSTGQTLGAPARTYAPTQRFIQKLVGTKTAANNRVSESLDYEPIQNKLFYDRMKSRKEGKKKLYGYTGHTLAKFLVTFVTGIITGCFAVALSKSSGWLTELKLHIIESSMEKEAPARIFVSFLWFWFLGACMVSLATAMVQYWAPSSAGAGVTLVMAYLNGNHVPNLLRFETLITKFVGTVCAVGSGLPMGPEGPMVHIGACVASVITYMECKCLSAHSSIFNVFGGKGKDFNFKDKLKILDDIVSDSDHREFVSAGVAAGISAAFGAPIGGVLFAMEEACSFWNRKTAWRCFLAAILSTFTIQLLNRSAQHGMIAFTNLRLMDNSDWLMQLPFLLVNAAMSGLIGAVFNSLRMWLWRMRAVKTRHLLRILEVIGLVFLVSLFGHFFGWTAGTCKELPKEWEEENYGLRFNCPEGEYNDIATLFLSSQHHTIIKLFSVGHNDMDENADDFNPPFSKGALALYTTIYLGLMSVGAGLAIPGGLFMPSILVGASWGCFWGTCLRGWLPSEKWNVQPGLYAILAGTGVLGGVFRSAISLVVLVVEGTRGIDYLFGVILSVVMANFVANHIHHDGVYESELERIGNVYMLRDEPPHRLFTLTSEAIMATGVYGYRHIESVERILDVLTNTTHNGFPVFTADLDEDDEDMNDEKRRAGGLSLSTSLGNLTPVASSKDLASQDASSRVMPICGRLEGLILRSQLLVLLQRRHFCDENGQPVGRDASMTQELELETEMRTFFRHNFTHARYVSSSQHTIDTLKLTDPSVDLSNLYLDLRPYMNRSPLTVRKDCSAARAHQVFVNLGLRHLLVVDVHNLVVGMITRKDLDHAAGHGWWRMSHNPQEHAQVELSKFAKGLNKLGLGWMVASVDSHGGHSAHGHDQQHQDEEQGGGHGNGMANGGSRH